MRSINCLKSSSKKTLLSDSIGLKCSIGAKLEEEARPTLCVGESDVINEGFDFSNSIN